MYTERITGIVIFLLGMLTFFVIIPFGIVSPSNVSSLALAPDFWPKIVAALFALMGLLMVMKPIDKSIDEEIEEKATPISWATRIPRLAIVLAALFSFYGLLPTLGMVVPAIFLIFGLMLFAGERKWLRITVLSLSVPISLYCFFVFVAQIPIPLGIFEFLRG